MSRTKLAFLFLAAVGVTFAATQLRNNYVSWNTYPLSEYIRVPNATEESKQAATAYLETVLGEQDVPATMEALARIVKVPVWTFTNDNPALYLRGGVLNGESHSPWAWSIPLGNIQNTAIEAKSTIEAAWAVGDLAMAEDYLVTLTEVANRLLAGNPPLIQNLIGVRVGNLAASAAQGCPGIAETPAVNSAMKKLKDLATLEPGVRWELETGPVLWGTFSPEDHNVKIWNTDVPTWLFRLLANRNSLQQNWRALAKAGGSDTDFVQANNRAFVDSWINLAPFNFHLLAIGVPSFKIDDADELRVHLEQLLQSPRQQTAFAVK